MHVADQIRELTAGMKQGLRQIEVQRLKRQWEYDALIAGISAILDAKRRDAVRLMRGEGVGQVARRDDPDIEDFKRCIEESDRCEEAGDYVLGVFLEVPDALSEDVSPGQVCSMLRNEFEWWERNGMARAATAEEATRDERAKRFEASLRRLSVAMRLAA